MFYMKNGELCHMDDELYHWKYINRKRVNGKWQYEYPNETTRATQARQNNRKDSPRYRFADPKPTRNNRRAVEAHQNQSRYHISDKDGVQYIKRGGEDKYGTYSAGKDWTYNYIKTNDLFSSTSTVFYGGSNGFEAKKVVTKKEGKLERAINKGKKWLSNLVKKKK